MHVAHLRNLLGKYPKWRFLVILMVNLAHIFRTMHCTHMYQGLLFTWGFGCQGGCIRRIPTRSGRLQMTRLLSSAGNPHQCCRWCRRSPRKSVSFPPPLLSPASPSSDRFRRCRTSFSSWAGTCSPGTPSGGAASTSRPPRGKLPSPLPQEASTVSPDSAKKSCQIMLKTCDQMSQISPFFAWTILEPCYLYIGKTNYLRDFSVVRVWILSNDPPPTNGLPHHERVHRPLHVVWRMLFRLQYGLCCHMWANHPNILKDNAGAIKVGYVSYSKQLQCCVVALPKNFSPCLQ